MNATNRVAVLNAPLSVTVEVRPRPNIGPHQVRVQLEGCGICGSNLPVWEGRPWFDYPRDAGAPGHEGWGRVEAIGDKVETVKIGTRVALLSYHAFAEYDITEADRLIPLPAALDGLPFPGEALGCAMNVFRRSDIRAGQTVAIVGVGFLGAVLVSLAKNAGARVVAISRRPFARSIAQRMGATETFSMENLQTLVAAMKELTDGRGCERVIEATGLQGPLDLAGELTAERGRLIIAGYHQDGLRQVNLQLWNWRGLDVINAHERDPAVYVEGMREAVSAIEGGRLDPAPLYTDRFPLEKTAAALNHLRDREAGFMKALLVYD